MVSSARISSLYDPLVAFFRLLRLCSTRFDIQVNGLDTASSMGADDTRATERTSERTNELNLSYSSIQFYVNIVQ